MKTTARFRTILIEPDTMFRTMFARSILLSDRFSLVADFADLDTARVACPVFKPEIIVLDVDFSPEESIEFIEVIVRQLPDAGVLAISAAADPLIMYELARADVHGFVQRSDPIEILEEAMAEVASRKRYLPASFQRNRERFENSLPKIQSLTPTERLLLRKIASGMTSRLIAADMNLSPRTIETYRSRLMNKLHVPNSAALVEYALRKGLVAERRADLFAAQGEEEISSKVLDESGLQVELEGHRENPILHENCGHRAC